MSAFLFRRKTVATDPATDDAGGALASGARPVFRFATPADEPALERLAALDSTRVPRGDLLVASVGGELWAAVSLDYDDIAADPFKPSGELVWTLLEQARDLTRRSRRGMHGRALIHARLPRLV